MSTYENPLEESGGRSLEAELVAAEAATRVGPDSLTEAPVVADNPAAIAAYTRLAECDAASGCTDVWSVPATPPSTGLVVETAQTPLHRLGERFAAFHTLYVRGLLGRVDPEPVTRRQILRQLWPYLVILGLALGAVIIVEVIYGATAADLLARNQHWVSVTAAVATTLLFNGLAWYLGHVVHHSHPQLLRRRGLLVALGGALAITFVVACLGLVIGGWDPVQITTVTGGGANQVTAVEADHRPLLAATYIGLVLLASLTVGLGHYLLLAEAEERYVHQVKSNQRAAAEASLSRPEQRALATRLAQAYLDAIPTAVSHVRRRIEAYNAGFTRRSTPDVNDGITLVAHEPVDPLWATQAQRLLTQETDPDPVVITSDRFAS